MNNDFRNRVLLPVVLPVLGAAGFLFFAFSLSRVLLAVPEMTANLIALGIAAYLLALGGLIAARPRIGSKALGTGLVVGLLSVGVAGALGAQAGMRELHHADDHAEAEEPDDDATPAFPDGTLVFTAIDIDFTDVPDSWPAGEVTIGIDNQGGILHNVVFEEADVHVEAQGGQTAHETYDLAPGTYTYYCDVPGHRNSMQGTIELS